MMKTAVDQLADNGAIVLRGVIPADAVVAAREVLLRAVQTSSLGRRVGGSLVPHQEGCEGWWRPYTAMQSCEEVHRLGTAPGLRSSVQELLGGRLLDHVRRPITLLYPGLHVPLYQTRPLVQGDPNTINVWVPLEARSAERGQPMAAPADRLLALRSHPAAGAELDDVPPEIADAIRVHDIEPGDAVLYHGLSVRGVGANFGPDLLFSIEFRVQHRWGPICRASLEPHHYPRVPATSALTRGWADRSLLRAPGVVRLSRFHMPSTVERWHLELGRTATSSPDGPARD